MSVGVYVRDFAVGIGGAAVIRNSRHTVVAVDLALTPRARAQAALDLMTDAEIAEWLPSPAVA